MGTQHRTARRFKRPSPLFRWADARGYLDPAGRALVFGAGLLVESEALAQKGWQVDALETPDSLERRTELYGDFKARSGCRVLSDLADARRRYRAIVVTHVVEFIESPRRRASLLTDLSHRLANNGLLFISLRGWSDVRAAKTQVPRGDGIVTGLGTWTRGFTVAEAERLVSAAGLTVWCSPHPKSKSPEQVRLVCRRA